MLNRPPGYSFLSEPANELRSSFRALSARAHLHLQGVAASNATAAKVARQVLKAVLQATMVAGAVAPRVAPQMAAPAA